MSQSELERSPGQARRIRHEACDGLAVAGVSLAASVLVTVVLQVLAWWLG